MKRIDSLAQRPILDANMSTNIIHYNYILRWWLGSRVVSAEGHGFKSQARRCQVTVLGQLLTPIVPLFTKQQKLVAALLRVAGVTAGLAESNGSLPPGL